MTRFRNTGQPDWDWWGELWPDPEDVLRRVGLDPCTVLADVGCGDGYFAVPAARLVETVYAVDVDDDLLSDLRKNAENADVAVEAVEGDARELPSLLPERVDGVLLANLFHGVSDRSNFTTTMREALRESGRLAVVNWRPLPHEETTVDGEPRGPPSELRVAPDETRDALSAGGFSELRTVDLPPYHYAVVGDRRDEA